MVSKRSKFALLASVFALYGCASGSIVKLDTASGTADISKNIEVATATNSIAHTTGLKSNEVEESFGSIAFKAQDPYQNADRILVNTRDSKGVMLTQKAFEEITKEIDSDAKENIKRKEEEKKKKELVKQMGAASDSKGGFSPKTTTYGVDCYGCNNNNGLGSTAVGVAIDINRGVRMPDGSWQPGIKYGNYYIIAADPSVPLCSVVKISNHGLSGSGITPSEPYFAIVLDRGGAIYGSHIDLFIGSENSGLIKKVQNTSARAEIVRVGGRNGNSCAV